MTRFVPPFFSSLRSFVQATISSPAKGARNMTSGWVFQFRVIRSTPFRKMAPIKPTENPMKTDTAVHRTKNRKFLRNISLLFLFIPTPYPSE